MLIIITLNSKVYLTKLTSTTKILIWVHLIKSVMAPEYIMYLSAFIYILNFPDYLSFSRLKMFLLLIG